MDEYDPREMVERLKGGRAITKEELEHVRIWLRAPTSDDLLYNSVRALALAGAPTGENVALVEQFLTLDTDDYVLQGVIFALCEYWGLTAMYLDQMLQLIERDQWERLPSATIAAFGALGNYLEETQDESVYSVLVKHCDTDLASFKSGEENFDPLHFEWAFRAIEQGIKGKKEARLSLSSARKPESFDQEVLEEARRRAKGQVKTKPTVTH